MKKIIATIATTFCINVNAQIINTIAGNGIGGFSGDGGQATSAELREPYAVAFDAVGNMYIADYANHRIRKINTAGIINTIAGNGTAAYSGDGGQATAAELYGPQGIAFDAIGNMYFTDSGNNRVRKVNTAGIISTVAGPGTCGGSVGSGCGDGGYATAAELYRPVGIAIDAAGNLYIADTYDNRVRMVNSLGIINTVAGNGQNNHSGDGGPAGAASIRQPTTLAFDATGNMYICEQGNYQIRMVNTADIITTIAGSPGICGGNSYCGDGGQATAAGLYFPTGITLDAVGNLYIADADNNAIRMINPLGIITTITGKDSLGTGISGYNGDGGLATAAELHNPVGVTFDVVGNMYIADAENNCIRKVSNVGQASNINQVIAINKQINIYPNPNNGTFIIETNSSEKQTLLVYDINGKLVLTQTINGKTDIDASSLNEGIYNISIIGNGNVVNRRLVITR